MQGVNDTVIGKQRSPFQDIAQLADIARPGKPLQLHQRLGIDGQSTLPNAGTLQERIHQQADVFKAMPQGR
ncbi:hypothetical protein D3C71_2008670 [compost metagenome]